jgi:hypothetical protein
MARVSSEEPPPDEKEHDESNASKRTILEYVSSFSRHIARRITYLFHQQLPINTHSGFAIFHTILS